MAPHQTLPSKYLQGGNQASLPWFLLCLYVQCNYALTTQFSQASEHRVFEERAVSRWLLRKQPTAHAAWGRALAGPESLLADWVGSRAGLQRAGYGDSRGDSLEAPEWVRHPRQQKSLGIEGRSTKVVIWGICDAWIQSDHMGGGVTLQSVASTGGRWDGLGLRPGEGGGAGALVRRRGGQAGRMRSGSTGLLGTELAGEYRVSLLRVGNGFLSRVKSFCSGEIRTGFLGSFRFSKSDVLDPGKHSISPRTYHSSFPSPTACAHGLPSYPGPPGSEGQVQMVVPGPAVVGTSGLYDRWPLPPHSMLGRRSPGSTLNSLGSMNAIGVTAVPGD